MDSVFNTGKASEPAPISTTENENIDDLIASVFKPEENRANTPAGTVLGTENSRNQPTDCECVPYYQCQNNSILDNGIGLIDIRSAIPDSNDNPNG